MSDAPCSIRVEGVRKAFRRRDVLKGVNLDVPEGSIFGFLGLNGAGKTTLIRILMGLLRPEAGRCMVGGIDVGADPLAVRASVGYMAENQSMYGWMSVDYIVDWVGRFYPAWDMPFAREMRDQMRLRGDAKVGELSKGQASRLALLLALAQHPRIVILDDPTLGLDPVARREFLRDVIGRLQASGATVLFSSHLLYEIEPICDHVAILHDGVVMRSAPVDELREKVKRIVFEPGQQPDLAAVPGVLDVDHQDARWAVTVEDADRARPALASISRNGLAIMDLNLDEIFEAYVIGRRPSQAGRIPAGAEAAS